jgi:hypothetical protein
MNTSFVNRLAPLVLGVTVIAGTFSAKAEAPYGRSPFIGTWVLTIAPPGPVSPYMTVATFAHGGTTTGTPPEKAPPPVVSLGDLYGVWAHAGDGTYASTIVGYTYDANGAINGTIKFNNSYTLISKDQLEGISQYLVCDLNLVCSEPTPDSVKLSGTRLKIQPIKR